jgi:puromycin-sensitive aminopeptidase
MKNSSIRLPRNVWPIHYDIQLAPNLELCMFNGSVRITLQVSKPTKEIVFHAKELDIGNVACFPNHGAAQFPIRTDYDREKDRVKLVFENEIKPGVVYLRLDFKGTINDQMVGFYRSTYEVDGEKRTMALTQFEDSDARLAFPCWDEPAIKATFKLTFRIPKSLEVVSNTPVAKERYLAGGMKEVSFRTTPIMSTYLAAFAVGLFERIEATTKDGTKVGVLTTPGKKDEGQFALGIAVKILDFYNEYFGTPYPLYKLDMLAVPDFAAGAMENWGLITYRETAILVSKEHSSAARLQRVATVVAHELAHQWFGNLVTMEWWTQLWLNEGFATFMQYHAVDHVFPEWDIWDQFTSEEMSFALSADALRTTHAVEVEINHPSEIGQNFDAISYSKGAAIIRMIHEHIGALAFRDGLRLYLKRHAYKNAVTEDLWQALEEVSGKPVREIMDSWTKQKGYPLVTIVPHETKADTYVFSQERFLSSGTELLQEEREQVWHIAIPYVTGTGEKADVFFSTPTAEIVLPHLEKGSWLKCNSGRISFIRVKYPATLLHKLGDAVRNHEIESLDRADLINDLYSIVRGGRTQISDLLNFLECFGEELEYVVWDELLGVLREILSLIPESDVATRASFSSILRRILVESAVARIGWNEQENETHAQKLLRPIILSAAAICQHKDTLLEAKRRFTYFVDDKSTLNPNLRTTVCRIASRVGGNDEFEALLRCYRGTDRQEEKVQYISAMALFEDELVAQKVLEFAFSHEVRPQDYFIYSGSLDSKVRAARLWKFVTLHWDEFLQRYEASFGLLSSILKDAICGMETHDELANVEQFFVTHPSPKSKERDGDRLLSWIENHK